MTSPGPAPIRRRLLGSELRRMRREAGLRQEQVSEYTGLSQGLISKLERALVAIEVRHVRLLCSCYLAQMPPEVRSLEEARLLQLQNESEDRGLLVDFGDDTPSFAARYIELEPTAAELMVHEPALVFGLFQTRDYIRALRLGAQPDITDEELTRSIEMRIARQEECLRGGSPPVMRVILGEAALHQAVGGPHVMAAQLRHLVELSQQPFVDLRIVPFSRGAHPSMGKPFSILRFAESQGMDVVYIESARSATYHDRANDLAYYLDLFERITEVALGVDESRELLVTLISDLWMR